MSSPVPASARPPRLHVEYVATGDPATLLAREGTLAVFGFGDDAPRVDDPRYLRVPLQPHGAHRFEAWRTGAPVRAGRDHGVAWACDGTLQFGAIEIDEPATSGDSDIAAASREAYARLSRFVEDGDYPHLLRTWNYFDAITAGDGDDERYRRFCVGRVQGLGRAEAAAMPAATAIGRRDGVRRLQVYWLSARLPGTAVGNPRQLDPWRYPREYGPQSPSFARAMLPPGNGMPLLLSGTAAIVGHASRHADAPLAQLDELLANFDSLLGEARRLRPSLPERFGAGSRLKVYVRDAADLPRVAQALDARFGDTVPRIVLHAAVCRRELAVEIDGSHAEA